MLSPHRICRLLGHKREQYVAGYYYDRRGRQRERWHARCKRCGTSDGGEVYNEGLVERFTWFRIRTAWMRAKASARVWWREDCWECKRPIRRLGRPVGQHQNCGDEIPF